MRLTVVCALAAAVIALGACTKHESAAEVQRDVAKAKAEGERNVADAQADAKEANADADRDVAKSIADHDQDDVAKAAHDANETADKGKEKIVIAQAEADHKIAVEKCDALEGSQQRQCKDDADKTLDQAKEAAKANR